MNGVVKEGSIGEVLLRSRIITEGELQAALEAQKVSGSRIGEALVKMGVVTQEDIDWALSHQLNIPYVRLKKENLDPAAIARVPAQLARRYQLIPLFLSGEELSIAMADPLNREAVEAVAEASGCQVTISVGLIREIREMHDIIYGPEPDTTGLNFVSPHFAEKVLDTINADLTGTTLLNRLLLYVVQQKCGSLALQPVGETVLVVARSGGNVSEIGHFSSVRYPSLLERIRSIAKLEYSGRSASNGTLLFMWQGKRIPFQLFMLRAAVGEYVTVKLHISSPHLNQLWDLEVSAKKKEDLKALTATRRGLILFALADSEERCRFMDLFVDACDTAGRTVLLFGDGLGRGTHRFTRIPTARECCSETPFLLTQALEHDPDLLVVEDATDVASFVAASKAVMRGKLVVAGLALSDKLNALKQLLYLRQKNYLIPSQLSGIVCCKGVRVLCPSCKESYAPSTEELAALKLPAPHFPFYRPTGCPACDHTGYSGRRYLLDVIRFDKRLLEAFELLRDSSEIVRFMKDNGYRGLTEEGVELLEKGEISPGEFVAAILL
ncbi:Flp pilus assembly complex ATPase component TadA [Geomonas sp. RF6]|uniref:ATPase, T2SS/T4P/T4SS family n=1 Tax=Geomonas sp. RF6 TaxID=2897342 RepID=UPI001E38EF37|nr:ATPase, T2SS/T4P/T4SS family [Geomonas sp. RF6]UFS71922.1 Flp pilus assembly complex ATPase component TadA [Geomonas sp. RF6]